jgi:hypothetical protein
MTVACYLVEQLRYPVKGRYWEFPKGSWEQIEGADPLEMARGELREETGPLPDKPSIVVLPFANLSGDREQEYFANGMVEEIIFSNRHFSGVLDPSPLPGVQRFTRLILAHRHP